MSSVGKPIAHDSAVAHVTGRAAFLDDLPPLKGELVVGFVGSPVARGTIVSVDLEAARRVPGVVALFTASEVAGENHFGPIFHDEPFLAQDDLLYVGQPVVVVAAEDQDALDEARAAVRIEADEQEPILTIEEAVAQEAFLGPARRIARGDADRALATAPHVLEGTFTSGGQEQFYFESQAAVAYPGEEGQVLVHSSTQNPSEIQLVVAQLLGLGQHQVVCVCKRMGGGFGGKETQAALPAAMAALVAHRTGRSARLVYGKDEDMKVTGKRHAYRSEWQVGFEADGTITALKVRFYSNGGAAADLSTAILERTLLHAENAYYLPNVEVSGRVCFTNLPPNTAFRGFGGPQGVAAMENVIEDVAQSLGLDAYEVRRRNLYQTAERNTTPYGQLFVHNNLPEIFEVLARTSGYEERRLKIDQANRKSRTELRGIAMTPVKFGISFTTRFLNQGNALVHVLTDGTVQVSTGGTEMGQGLNTKIRQLVADEFSIDPEQVLVLLTSTEKNANTSPTAASASTDLNGTAAVRACRTIRSRLEGFAASLLAHSEDGVPPSPKHVVFEDGEIWDTRRPAARRLRFAELAQAARQERIDLGARGFYATPGIDFNRDTGRGTPFAYYTQGAAVAEVTIQRLSGALEVPRVDLLMDIGKSINPGVDRGQIVGGFLQGMGWVTLEELCYDERGHLLSHSPTTYKIPAVTDLPAEFYLDLFESDEDHRNVASSKGVGEPPLLLGVSVWAAIKHALGSLAPGRRVDLRLPATHEEVLRVITNLAPPPEGVTQPSPELVEAR